MPRIPAKSLTNGHANGQPKPTAPESPSSGRNRVQVASHADDVPELAREPDLIQRILFDIAALGVVGEQDNALLIYHVFVSRLADEPAGIITRGVSAAGKTTLIRKVARAFPPEVKIDAMTLTPASLFNTAEDHLKRKILMLGERKHAQDDSTRDANALIRQLLSEKHISRGVSVYDKEAKRWNTEFVVREGPVAFAESTTAKSIFEEDLNRMIQVYVDDSEQQTRAIMRAIGSRYDPSQPQVDVEHIIEQHHDFQMALQPRKVCIPYWQALVDGMPAGKVEARRVVQQVLTVIEATVLLHQYQREERDGCLLATPEDYALARRLLLGPLKASLESGDDRAFEAYQRLRDKFPGEFTNPAAVKAGCFGNKMACKRALDDLQKLKVIKLVAPSIGRNPARWTWTGQPVMRGLPTVEELFA